MAILYFLAEEPVRNDCFKDSQLNRFAEVMIETCLLTSRQVLDATSTAYRNRSPRTKAGFA